MLKTLVCGGRDYADIDRLFTVLDELHRRRHISTVVHGNALGADKLAGYWARSRGRECVSYPADWKRLGRVAGFIRNQRMLDEERPDLVVVFPGGRGTADMLMRAKMAGVETIIVGI